MAARSYFAWLLLKKEQPQDRSYTRVRAKARASSNPLKYLSDNEFKNRYRLSKISFKRLCMDLRRHGGLRSTQRVKLEEKVLTALLFFATGSYQRIVGVAKNLSQKMCSVYIEEVTQALICKNMLNKYINFPDTPAARREISQRFYTKYGVPGVIGCVDGSHFRIFGPPKEEEHSYYCRKHYHSLNVQMICDDNYRILNVNAKFGGANHDAFIWENSNINPYMQSLHENGEKVWLLGDSGYPQRPWLMTPILNAASNTPEAQYNEKQMRARVVIENVFGKLKNRWRCCNKDRTLHYKPLKCAQIIQACCVLHNFCIKHGMADMEDLIPAEDDVEEEDNEDLNVGETERGGATQNTTDLIRGRIMRDQLVRRMC
ncbi:putative nuclease HARBI1 isoform X1 [Plutella xylostella]|uniref:putative nuclease HARBI1 isoform X1 n=1 Tax=Plutella xylostella TaxID=51655 RepID=UPI0020329E4F|nr:putative nuclease HARBI1 isoform X1 [Plutella xylostella]